MPQDLYLWLGFSLFILVMLTLDLGLFHRKAHSIRISEALIWTAVWIILALIFNLGILYWRGSEAALQFLTGYLLEKSLSVDNIFVFILIFSYFRVPEIYQHKVLFWGIVGALVMRVLLIFAGVALITQFHWTIYIFGAFLVLTGIRIALEKDKQIHPEKNPVLRVFRRLMPVLDGFEGGKFWIRKNGKFWATQLFVVLLIVETTDLIFAVDSIPAIMAITTDTFIIYTSNVFAMLGLRSLYFALAGAMRLFHNLHYGLAAILVFVGIKMLITDLYKIPIVVSLSIVAAILTLSVAASLLWPKRE